MAVPDRDVIGDLSYPSGMNPLQIKADSCDRLRFAVHCNHVGQILLVPELSIPLHEAWLYRNPTALKSVLTGIKQASNTGHKRNAVSTPAFTSH